MLKFQPSKAKKRARLTNNNINDSDDRNGCKRETKKVMVDGFLMD